MPIHLRRRFLAPFICLTVFFPCGLPCLAQPPAGTQAAAADNQSTEPLKELSLDQLGNVEVTTASKEPTEIWQTPAANFRDHPGRYSALRRHQLRLASSFDLSKSVALDLSARYISALPAQMVRAYTTGNATLGWSVSPHFRVSFVGDNLLQPHHAEDGGDPGVLVEIQRSAYAKLTWTTN